MRDCGKSLLWRMIASVGQRCAAPRCQFARDLSFAAQNVDGTILTLRRAIKSRDEKIGTVAPPNDAWQSAVPLVQSLDDEKERDQES